MGKEYSKGLSGSDGHGTNGTNGSNGSNGTNGTYGTKGTNRTNETNEINGNNEINGINEINESNGINEKTPGNLSNINSKDKEDSKDSDKNDKNHSSVNEIIKIEKVIVPFPYRGLASAGQFFLSEIPIVNIATLPYLQQMEHHGLIFEVSKQYGSSINVSLKFCENKEVGINEIIDCCYHCNRKYFCYDVKIPNNSSISIQKIKNIIDELSERFNPAKYDTIKNNCQLYVKALLLKLFIGKDLSKNIYKAMLSSFFI